MKQESTRKDIVEVDEDIDVMRPDVDLRIERLSDRSVSLARYNGGDKDDIDYSYWYRD
jgi:hypothetical protein